MRQGTPDLYQNLSCRSCHIFLGETRMNLYQSPQSGMFQGLLMVTRPTRGRAGGGHLPLIGMWLMDAPSLIDMILRAY